MKLSALKAKPQVLSILDVDGEDTGIKLKLISIASTEPVQLASKFTDEVIQSEGRVPTSEQHRMEREVLVSCVIDWEGMEDDEGNPIPFSKETALEILMDPEYYDVLVQVAPFVAKRANFFRGSKAKATTEGSAVSSA